MEKYNMQTIKMRIREIKNLLEEALYLNDGSYELLIQELEDLGGCDELV